MTKSMDARFSQLSSQDAKSLFMALDGQSFVLWIWEKGHHLKKIPITVVLKKDFTISSHDELIPEVFKRASLLGTFECRGFYYFLKLLSRDLSTEVQFLCDPIIFKNERRRRKRFQITKSAKDFQIVIPLRETPPLVHDGNGIINLFPLRLFKTFLSHLSSISEGKPLFHIAFPLYDISPSGLSFVADDVEAEFMELRSTLENCLIVLNKDKFEIKKLELVHKSTLPETEKERDGLWRLGYKFEADDWTSKKIQILLEQERENIVKEFDSWSK